MCELMRDDYPVTFEEVLLGGIWELSPESWISNLYKDAEEISEKLTIPPQ